MNDDIGVPLDEKIAEQILKPPVNFGSGFEERNIRSAP